MTYCHTILTVSIGGMPLLDELWNRHTCWFALEIVNAIERGSERVPSGETVRPHRLESEVTPVVVWQTDPFEYFSFLRFSRFLDCMDPKIHKVSDLLSPLSDPKKGSLKRKQKRSQGSSRYRLTSEVELQPLPLLKGKQNITCVYFLTFIFSP